MVKVNVFKRGYLLNLDKKCEITVTFSGKCSVKIDAEGVHNIYLSDWPEYVMPIVTHLTLMEELDKELLSVLLKISDFETSEVKRKWIRTISSELSRMGKISDETKKSLDISSKISRRISTYASLYRRLISLGYYPCKNGLLLVLEKCFKENSESKYVFVISCILYNRDFNGELIAYEGCNASEFKIGKMMYKGEIDVNLFKRKVNLDELFRDAVDIRGVKRLLGDHRVPKRIKDELLPYVVTSELK